MISRRLQALFGAIGPSRIFVGIRSGRSHGATVETDIVQSDLTLVGTTFRDVPVFVADFPKATQCLFDGALGSEVLPLCAWQIDLWLHRKCAALFPEDGRERRTLRLNQMKNGECICRLASSTTLASKTRV